MSSSLFDDFKPVTKQEWIAKVTQDLKGKDFAETMNWQTDEGFEVEAMYMETDMEKVNWVQQFENRIFHPEKAHIQSRYWQNCNILSVENEKETNRHALEALQNGAEALVFQLKEEVDLKPLLNEVLLPYCGVYFYGKQDAVRFLSDFVNYTNAQNYDLIKIEGGCLFNTTHEELAKAIELTQNLPHFKVVGIQAKGNTVAERIASIFQEIYTILEGVKDKGISPKQLMENLYIHYPVSSTYFLEIAGLRALRILLTQVAAQFNMELPAYAFSIHAFTTLDEAEEDSNQFMLSNTTQAMSAILGGASAVTVLPHTFQTEKNSRFALRIARNVSNLLKEESYLDKVADPSAGSYYIETLTAKLAEKAWEIFQSK